MFQSRLAPAPGGAVYRDLSSFEIWEMSLARSRRRRDLAERQRKAAPKTKGAAAAMSAALLVSPVLPLASAGAQSDGSGPASAPPNPSPDVGGVIVERGDVGGTVAEVQRKVGVDDDGVFGAITERAVRDFQARSGLERTGVVDVTTWKALFRASVSFVRADSAAAKRIVAQLPRRPQAPKRQNGAGGGPPSAAGGSQSAAPSAAEPGRSTRAPAPAAPAPAAPASPGSGVCGGKIVSPVRGTVTSRFGDGRNHEGVDIAAPVGTVVRAAACGTVSLADSQSGYGNIICVEHSSSFSTCYAHLSQMNVRQGTYVNVGQVIGRVGMTGRTTGPHLHFETRVSGRAQDPAPYLGGARSIPGEPQARTSRAATAPRAKASTQAVARQAAAPPAQQQAPEPAPAPAAAQAPAPAPAAAQAPEPAPAPAQAPAPAPAAAHAPEPAPAPAAAQAPEPAPAPAAAQAPEPAPPAAPHAPQQAPPATGPPAAATPPPAADTAPTPPAPPSTAAAAPAAGAPADGTAAPAAPETGTPPEPVGTAPEPAAPAA